MKSPTKTQRTAAAKAMLKACKRNIAGVGCVSAKGFWCLHDEIVICAPYGVFIGEAPNDIPVVPEPPHYFDWKSFVNYQERVQDYAPCTDFDVSAVHGMVAFEKGAAYDAGKKYDKDRCTMRYTLPSGKEIGLNCERLLTMCKLVGPENKPCGVGWNYEPTLFLPMRPNDPVKIVGEYGTAYLLPVRL